MNGILIHLGVDHCRCDVHMPEHLLYNFDACASKGLRGHRMPHNMRRYKDSSLFFNSGEYLLDVCFCHFPAASIIANQPFTALVLSGGKIRFNGDLRFGVNEYTSVFTSFSQDGNLMVSPIVL